MKDSEKRIGNINNSRVHPGVSFYAHIRSTTLASNTWYINATGKNVILYLRLPYNTASSSSTYEIRTKNINGDERSIGTIVHALGAGSGADIIPIVLIPGQSVYTNFAGGGDLVTSTCLFIG